MTNMEFTRKMTDATPQDCLRELVARLRPTADTGEILEKRVCEVKEMITNKFGELGTPITAGWPANEREIYTIIPISMHDNTKIDAVMDIKICLCDDLQYPNKLTN